MSRIVIVKWNKNKPIQSNTNASQETVDLLSSDDEISEQIVSNVDEFILDNIWCKYENLNDLTKRVLTMITEFLILYPT